MLTREKIIIIYAEKIRQLMESALEDCLNEVYYGVILNEESKRKQFSILKELSLLTSEFLEDKKIENKILDLANRSVANGDDNEIKLKMFGIMRNIIAHLPFFETYDEIVLSRDILTWNSPKFSSILKFFDDNDGKIITSRIYYKFDNGPYREIKQIRINIKRISNEDVKLSSIISLSDAIWLFSIVDYYLDYLGLKIEPQFGLSI